jgi:dTDP-6-deoxy-L-talose 4-dehydrogenase (NAD+)
MNKLLLTGSTGFVGSALLPRLARRFKVYVIVRSDPKKKLKKVVYVKINLLNKKKIFFLLKKEKFKYLIHLAWEARPKIFWNSKNNINFFHLSTNLYYNFCKFGGKFAILAGSSAETNLSNKIVEEKETKQKFTFSKYSISKYLFFRNAKKISNIFKSRMLWARLFWIYGDKQPKGKLFSDLARHVQKKKKFIIKNKYDSINMMHVEDVAEALYKLIIYRIEGVANIASKKNYKIFQLISMIRNKKLKKKIVLKNFNNNYNFKKIITNKLKNIFFKERFNIRNEFGRIAE